MVFELSATSKSYVEEALLPEKEMATLQENSILYKAALQLINKKLGSIRYAVTDGGR